MKYVFLILIMPLVTFLQHNHAASSLVKALTFYVSPGNSGYHYKSVRSEDHQVKTGDSTVYNIQWGKDCQYALTYLSSSKQNELQRQSVNRIKLPYDNLRLTSTFHVNPDTILPGNIENRRMSTDTASFQPLVNPTNKEIFRVTKESPVKVKRDFTDTSQYALLYLYRLHKSTPSANEYYVYFGEDSIFRATNKTKAIYKIFKEGPVKIHAKSGNVESSVMIHIQFGKKYYIQCQVNFRTAYPTPAITLEELTDGEIWFNSF